MATNVDTRDLSFAWLGMDQLPDDIWAQWAELEQDSLVVDLPRRSLEERDIFLDLDGDPNFRQRRIDPNLLVGGRHVPDQEEFRPRLVAAFNNRREMVAAAYTVSNVSGSNERVRQIKKVLPFYNYVALSSIVESPNYKDRGLMEVAAALSVRGLRRFRPMAVYPLTEEPVFIMRLAGMGFYRTTGRPIPHPEYFGEEFALAYQHRYEVRFGHAVISSVAHMPGGRESLNSARRTLLHDIPT